MKTDRMPIENRRYGDLSYFPVASPPSDPRGLDVEEAGQAVRLAHATEIDRIEAHLRNRKSVLVVCNKELTRSVLRALGDRFGAGAQWPEVTFNQSTRGTAVSQLVETLVVRLGEAVPTPQAPHKFLVISHLDLMAWTATDEPGPYLNDVIYWLSERPDVTVLAFWDSGWCVPETIKRLMPIQVELGTVPRDRLWQLVAPSEAQMLCEDHAAFTLAAQLRLYHYVSGLNVVRLRQVLRELAQEEGFAKHVRVAEAMAFLHRRACPGSLQPGEDWGQVVGYEAVRRTLERRVVFPMRLRAEAKSAQELEQADAMLPRGVLLYGPPGTGKTEWGKYLAKELKASFQLVRGPELKNMYVGETERAIRAVFARARRESPSLVLIDEIDAMLGRRDANSAHHEVSVVGQWLAEMSRLQGADGVLVVATTNRVQALDRAFFRPGRFGVKILIDYPGKDDRLAILKYHAERLKLPLAKDSLERLAQLTGGPVDARHAAEVEQYYQAYVQHCVNRPFHEQAGPLADARLRLELRLDDEERFSGDHLRAVCEFLLEECRFTKGAADFGQLEVLQRAVESVRPLVARRPAEAPPPPRENPKSDDEDFGFDAG